MYSGGRALEACVSCLLLDEPKVLLLLVQPNEEGMAKHRGVQPPYACLPADPSHFAV